VVLVGSQFDAGRWNISWDINSLAAVMSTVGMDVSPFAVVVAVMYWEHCSCRGIAETIVRQCLGGNRASANYVLGSLTIGCCGAFVIHFSQAQVTHLARLTGQGLIRAFRIYLFELIEHGR
jgi:hypothetical protein